MRKLIIVLGTLLALSLAFTSVCFADTDYDTLVDWEIQIPVPEDTVGVWSSDGNYYIYTQREGSIPYVMLRVYEGFEDEWEFILRYFNDFMAEGYSDLEYVVDYAPVMIGDRLYYNMEYAYTIQGHPVRDRRYVKTVNGLTYMFACKEVEELDMMVGDLLEEVALECVYLKDGEPIDVSETSKEPKTGDDGLREITWDLVEEEVEEMGIEGSFITFDEVNYEMFLPDNMLASSLPAGQTNPESFLGFYVTADGTAYAAIQFVEADITLDQYIELLGTLGTVEDIEKVRLNGNEFIVYFMPENDVMCLSTVVENSGLLEFSFYPSSDEDFGVYAEIIGCSIRPVEEKPFLVG